MGILLTKDSRFLIGPIAEIMGFIMNAIYEGLNFIGIQNVGLCIILFTIIIYMLMLPLQVRQQKFSRISAIMNPEIQAIQTKYKGKNDQASMIKMQDETKLIYEKYGTSPMGGCLGSLIQLPFLFALWPVVQNIPAYVDKLKNAYNQFGLITQIKATEGYQKILENFVSDNRIVVGKGKFSNTDKIVDILYKLQDSSWDALAEAFPNLENTIEQTQEYIRGFNYFPTAGFGINIAETPSSMFSAAIANFSIVAIIVAVAIPILAGATQYISVVISQKSINRANDLNKKTEENAMMSQMNMMTKIMPIMSVVFCFTMPVGLGLYWIASAVVRTIQQILIDKSLNKKSIDEIVAENMKKAEKKRNKKKQADSKNVNSMARTYTRRIEEMRQQILDDAEKDNKSQTKGSEKQGNVSTYKPNAKPGSLAAKANMVSDYNQRNNK